MPRGVEAVVHAIRAFVSDLQPTEVLVKLDFQNAFNSVRRDTILEVAAFQIPEKLHLLIICWNV